MLLRFQLIGFIKLVKHPPNIYASHLISPCRFLSSSTNNTNNNVSNKASPAQLVQLEEILLRQLPYVFNRPHTFDIYTKDLVFVDNIRNIKTRGIVSYALQINLIKFYYSLRYSSVKLELLNLVKHPDESYIRIRWRIVKKPGIILSYLFVWKIAKSFSKLERWKDGISTLHINNQGKIYCHICDNIDVGTDDIGNEANIVRVL